MGSSSTSSRSTAWVNLRRIATRCEASFISFADIISVPGTPELLRHNGKGYAARVLNCVTNYAPRVGHSPLFDQDSQRQIFTSSRGTHA